MSAIDSINTSIDNHQANYFGIMSVSILAGSCIASVAVIAVLASSAPMWELYLVCCTAMGANAAAISHSPLRWVVWASIVNIIVSTFLIVIQVF